jgi:hypothetical protein
MAFSFPLIEADPVATGVAVAAVVACAILYVTKKRP